MYTEAKVHCAACGSLVPRTQQFCPDCGCANLYRLFIPGEHSVRRLLESRAAEDIPQGDTVFLPEEQDVHPAPPHARESSIDRAAGTLPNPHAGRRASPADPSPPSREAGTLKLPHAQDDAQTAERSTVQVRRAYGADLVRLEPPGRPEQFRLEKGTLTLGFSRHTCDLILREDTVSEQHAQFLCREDDQGRAVVLIRDLGSTNGTFVNAERIKDQPRRLKSGDTVRFADISYRFRIRGK